MSYCNCGKCRPVPSPSIAERYHERLVESLRDFAERPEWYEYEGRAEGSIHVSIDVMNKARELLAEIARGSADSAGEETER